MEADLGRFLQRQHGLGLSELRALKILAKSPNNELRMQDLAAHMQLNQSSVSRMAERLERRGLALRDLCPDDKRGVYTVLTDAGRDCLSRAEGDYDAALKDLVKTHRLDANMLTIKQT
ncbi:MarR family winged helix-turn-helix transcriptional regulator [Rhizobium sp. CFBP 8762]|uniref:MarR family winged helix-turn-helix transcriptional regulator n=1 Tax=Rhizobium sp. CFBP 8762 TaxID=2775279 RepID=UPI00313D275D